MSYQQIPPPAALISSVECLWSLQLEGPAPEFSTERVTPDGCLEWIFHFGAPVLRLDRGGEEEPKTFVVGTLTRPIELRPLGRTEAIGVRFRPGGLARFFTGPIDQLTDTTVEAGSLFGPTAERLYRALSSVPPSKRLAILGHLLTTHLRPGREVHPAVSGVARALIASRGQIPLDRAIGSTGVGARQVQRLFRAQVGLTPKQLARIVRFQCLLSRLHLEPSPRWVDLALDCGYFDQAHLVREFRRLGGTSPARFLRQERPLSQHFTSPGRMSGFYNTGAVAAR